MQPARTRQEIALVDDDLAVRESLAFMLEVAGYQVAKYASAAEFLRACDLNHVKGLILDQYMPHVTGLELASRLRRQGWKLPILLVTAWPSPAIVARAAELGIKKVLQKPPVETDVIAFCASAALDA